MAKLLFVTSFKLKFTPKFLFSLGKVSIFTIFEIRSSVTVFLFSDNLFLNEITLFITILHSVEFNFPKELSTFILKCALSPNLKLSVPLMELTVILTFPPSKIPTLCVKVSTLKETCLFISIFCLCFKII